MNDFSDQLLLIIIISREKNSRFKFFPHLISTQIICVDHELLDQIGLDWIKDLDWMDPIHIYQIFLSGSDLVLKVERDGIVVTEFESCQGTFYDLALEHYR